MVLMRVLCLVLILEGCINDPTIACGDLECPANELCMENACVPADAVSACVGHGEGDGCTASALDGVCVGGVCRLAICGNGKLEPGEACDDGNQISGDGCSADCRSNETCGNGYIDTALGEQCDDHNVLSSDGCSSTCQLETAEWRDVSGAPIGARGGQAMAFDASHNQIMFFGGFSNTELDNDTWLWDGKRWTQVATVTSPSARAHAAVAYDSLRSRVVLFGGGGEQGSLGDTWSWDGFDWTELHPASSPPSRTFTAMAYDSARDRIVLYGGDDDSGLLGDTWEFDGTTWSQVTPTASPTVLFGHAMAFDTSRGVVVLSGDASTELGAGVARTWEYAGTTWKEVVTSAAPASYGLAMTYDTLSKRVLAFGGGDNFEAGFITGLYSYDGVNWTLLANSTNPPARRYAAIAYDAANDTTMLYGGDMWDNPAFGDQWVWQNGWTLVPAQQFEPQALWATNAIYDPLAGHLMLFGGVTGASAIVTDTWIRDRTGWTLLAPTTSPPATFSCGGLAYDQTHQAPLLFGADQNGVTGTWQWTGTTWHDVSPATMPPGTVCGQMMAHDPARGRTLLFGGLDGNSLGTSEIWEWDGTTWTALTPSPAPPARGYGAMTYDPLRERIVLFGGLASGTQDSLGDTWEWDGTTWTNKTPTVSPAARGFTSLTYDPQRHRVVLFGGTGITTFGDQWEWDGTTWTQVTFLDAPLARDQATMAYDAIQKQLVYFGGFNFRGVVQNTTLAQEYTSARPIERCLLSTDDDDGDGLAGCADPDCWARCAPLCPPGVACAATAPHCGDGTCSAVEDHFICPDDCP